MYGFRYSFTPLTGVLFILRSRYLFTIGRGLVLSLGRWSSQIQTRFPVSGLTWGIRRESVVFRLQGYHHLWQAFPDLSTRHAFVTPFPIRKLGGSPRNPVRTTPAGLHTHGLGSFPFARRYSGSRGFFPFLWVLRCFSSPRCPSHPMYSDTNTQALPRVGCPIRKSPDQCLLAASRSLSQPTTSFFDFPRQNIHHTPLFSLNAPGFIS